jgi:hypothetical protein
MTSRARVEPLTSESSELASYEFFCPALRTDALGVCAPTFPGHDAHSHACPPVAALPPTRLALLFSRASEHLQEFAKFYLENLMFCQHLKRYVK